MRALILPAVLGLTLGGAAASAPAVPKLDFPLACEIGKTCEVQNYVDRDDTTGVADYRCGRRTYDKHTGVDIRIPDMKAQARGVDVLAAAPGEVMGVRDGVADISIRAPGAPSVANRECGNGVVLDHGGGWQTQYCHMAKGSLRVKVGQPVTTGQPLGKVGLSGDTEFAHLHFAVRREGKTIDPFAPLPTGPGDCKAQAPLWTPEAAAKLAYKRGAILNAGFSGEAVTMPAIEAGTVAPFTAASPLVVTYLRVIGAEKGDELELTLTGPGGAALARNRTAPLESDKAQQFQMIGRRRPATGWPAGEYRADLKVWRGGKVAMQKALVARL